MSSASVWRRLKRTLSLQHDYTIKPLGFRWRSNTLFIVSTFGIAFFIDLFLYGLILPILPFILQDRLHLRHDQIQGHVSGLLTAFAGANVLLSPVAGAIGDKTSSRQLPFLLSLTSLLLATILLFTGTSVPVLVIARVAQGASSAFVWTIGMALCIDTVGPENLGKTIGSIFSFVSVGNLCAPVLGGALYAKAGYGAVAFLAFGLIVVDFVMRLLVLEKRVAARYTAQEPFNAGHDPAMEGNNFNGSAEPGGDQREESSLLGKKQESDEFLIPHPSIQPYIIRKIPILYCLTSPSLVTALVVAFIQAILLASFDATVTTHANDLYGFDSLKSGLLFVPLTICSLIIGPISGWAVDRYGTKPVAVFGYTFLVPMLALLRLPVAHPHTQQAILYGALLGLCGIGLATIGAPSLVEAGAVVDKFHKRNPDFFGEQGPYAQLYGMDGMVFNLGLSIGPIIAGVGIDRIGYGNMYALLSAISGVAAVLCFIWLGGYPKMLRRKQR